MHEMYNETTDRPLHRELRPLLFSTSKGVCVRALAYLFSLNHMIIVRFPLSLVLKPMQTFYFSFAVPAKLFWVCERFFGCAILTLFSRHRNLQHAASSLHNCRSKDEIMIISLKYFYSPSIMQLAHASDLFYLDCCFLSFESFSARSCSLVSILFNLCRFSWWHFPQHSVLCPSQPSLLSIFELMLPEDIFSVCKFFFLLLIDTGLLFSLFTVHGPKLAFA